MPGRPIVDFSESGARKRQRERERRAKFTPEQKQAAADHQTLYMQHRRLTDTQYLARCRETSRRMYQKHRAKRLATLQQKQRETRLRCLRAYSQSETPFCGCCGEEIVEFLTLDHLVDKRNDGGVRVGGTLVGQALYTWLIRMNFPPGFRVLCYNCNCARGVYGYCPHELQLDVAVEGMVV